MPRSFASGQPSTNATGRASTGPSTETPMNTTTAPRPTSVDVRPLETAEQRGDAEHATMHEPGDRAALRRRRAVERRRHAAPRSAAPSRPAGPASRPTRSVTIMPTAIETTIVLGLDHGGAARDVEADRAEQRLQHLRHTDAGDQAERRRDQADRPRPRASTARIT